MADFRRSALRACVLTCALALAVGSAPPASAATASAEDRRVHAARHGTTHPDRSDKPARDAHAKHGWRRTDSSKPPHPAADAASVTASDSVTQRSASPVRVVRLAIAAPPQRPLAARSSTASTAGVWSPAAAVSITGLRPLALPEYTSQPLRALLSLPVATAADVPLAVAIVGLLLLLASARGVSRLREMGIDDRSLSWD